MGGTTDVQEEINAIFERLNEIMVEAQALYERLNDLTAERCAALTIDDEGPEWETSVTGVGANNGRST